MAAIPCVDMPPGRLNTANSVGRLGHAEVPLLGRSMLYNAEQYTLPPYTKAKELTESWVMLQKRRSNC
jgi:hypothetical protein